MRKVHDHKHPLLREQIRREDRGSSFDIFMPDLTTGRSNIKNHIRVTVEANLHLHGALVLKVNQSTFRRVEQTVAL